MEMTEGRKINGKVSLFRLKGQNRQDIKDNYRAWLEGVHKRPCLDTFLEYISYYNLLIAEIEPLEHGERSTITMYD